MRNITKLILMTGASAMMALSGCEMMQHHNETADRTAGRALDDKTITAAVKHDLNQEPVYKFSDVDVRTFNGTVQLSGFVNTDEQKRRAGDIAQRVYGVAQVENNISLKQSGNLEPTSRPYNQNNPPPANR